jgi:glycerol-3-phosphate cytidylyltransferase-like family protein
MNTIHAKLRKELDKPFKLVVGLEADQRTQVRKNKTNVYNQEERKFIFQNMKPVDLAYIQFEHLDEQTNDKRPAGIIQFLQPDVMISHQEHIPPEEQEQVQERLQGKLVVI